MTEYPRRGIPRSVDQLINGKGILIKTDFVTFPVLIRI